MNMDAICSECGFALGMHCHADDRCPEDNSMTFKYRMTTFTPATFLKPTEIPLGQMLDRMLACNRIALLARQASSAMHDGNFMEARHLLGDAVTAATKLGKELESL